MEAEATRRAAEMFAKTQRYTTANYAAQFLRGIWAQLKADGRIIEGCYGIQLPDEDSNAGQSKYGPDQGYSGRYRDDLTGQVLRDDLVRQARKKELEYFANKHVWVKVPYQRAYDCTGRQPISA